MTVFHAHIADVCAWLETQVPLPKIVLSSSGHDTCMHQAPHVPPPDAHVPQEVLAEHALHELPVVNQQQLAHSGKPIEKFGAFSEHAPSTGYEPKSHDKEMLPYDQSTDYLFGNGGFLTVPEQITRKPVSFLRRVLHQSRSSLQGASPSLVRIAKQGETRCIKGKERGLAHPV